MTKFKAQNKSKIQMSKQNRCFVIWNLIFVIILSFGLCDLSFVSAETVGRIAAVVNDEIITSGETEEAIAQTNGAPRQAVLSRLVERRLILQKARQGGVTVSEEEVEEAIQKTEAWFPSKEFFEQQLARQGLSADRLRHHYRDQLIVKRMVDHEVKPWVSTSPQELRDYYHRHREEFKEPEMLHLSTLLIRRRDNPKEEKKAKALAQDLWHRIKSGESFEVLARQSSEGPRREEGGDLGWVEPHKFLKEISETLNSLKPGEVSPVLETAVGYHLFQLKERKSAGVVPFRKAKGILEKLVWEEKMQARYRQWIETLKKEAYIQIYE